MEMADAIVINKADGDNKKAAKLAKNEFLEPYIYILLKKVDGCLKYSPLLQQSK